MKNTTLTLFQKTSSILKTMLIILMTFGILSLKAGDITVKTGNADLKVKQNTNTKLQLSNSFTKFTYRDVKTNKGMFTQLSIPDYGTSNRIGDPQLPMLRKLIEIPLGADANVNVISYTLTEYNLSDYGISNKIIPSQPSVSKDPKKKLPDFEYNTATYNADQFNTDDLVSVDVLGVMRGVRLARLNIAPVRYNPVTNTIQVYNDIEVEVIFPGADVAQTIELKKKTASMYFESMYNNALLNYKKAHSTKDTVTKYPVKYVIVSDPAFQSTLQPYVQWKTKKGFTVVEAYTNNPAVGTTTTSIKNYLLGLYNAGTPSDPAPSFVLFVGDVAQVPSFSGTTDFHVSDLYYCEYTGDFFPEVYYGRFSATNTSELQPQIDKTLEYEQYLMTDPSFLGQVVMIAGQDATYGPLQGDGQINYGTDTYFNTAHGLTSHTYLYAVSGSSAAQIIQNVSEGVGFANYTAHGSSYGWADPSFSISDIAGLQNNHKYPLMVGNACSTNTFDGDCFGEELLRANDKGALGYIGGSNSTYWDEDYWWAVGYKTVVVNPVYSTGSLGSYDRTFHDHGEHFGEWYASQDQMIFAGNLAVTQSGSSISDYYWEVYHLMGDPSLMVYFGIPPALSATYTLISFCSTTFTVNTEPYAYVAVSMSDTLHGAALADSLGFANIPLSTFTVPGTADVVATKQNRAPFISTVTVATPTGPYVVYSSKLLHDVAGNNNGQADFGEDVTLDIALQNVGATTATGVSAKLRTNDNYVTITDSTQSWGDIANCITSTQNNAYSFTVHDFVPDQHAVAFTLVITDNNSNTWTGTFYIVLNAPVLTIGNITINDASGNNNGRLDPGETIDLIFASSNTGHANATNAVSTLASNSGSITVNTGSANLGTLNASGGSANASFNITVSPSAVIGSVVDFTNTLTAGLYSVQKIIYTMIGLVDEDWETGTFTKFQWVQGGNAPWTISNVDPYEGVDCAKSGTIADMQTSELQITFNALTNDSISFYKKVSSEDTYDFLKFYIDASEQGEWSGEVPWSRNVYPVTTGNHTFKWVYEKDYMESAGSDCAWIDYIIFPPIQLYSSVPESASNELSLSCFPNPVIDNAFINYTLAREAKVSLKIYNTLGQEVFILLNGANQSAGNHQVYLNGATLKNGIYYCVLNTGNSSIASKIIISK